MKRIQLELANGKIMPLQEACNKAQRIDLPYHNKIKQVLLGTCDTI